MKKLLIATSLVALVAVGCKNPVSVSGDYATPKQTIAGGVTLTPNSVTVDGSVSNATQSVGGSVTVGK